MFSSLTEQTAVAGQLQRSLQRGRVAHAYLFAGPAGSGKAAVAKTLAKALNCLDAEYDCCDACLSCRQVDKKEHPDVYWVQPESKSRRITVEQIREFERAVNLKSSGARVKVGIIVDADCMNEQASNAFLKTLEEPPPQTMILLLTSQPQRLLATIISRCLKISFGPVASRAVSPYRARLLPLMEAFVSGTGGRVVNAYRLLAGLTTLLQQERTRIQKQIEEEDDSDRYTELDAKARERLEEQAKARIEGEYRAAREQVLEELYLWFADVLLCVENAPADLWELPEAADAIRKAAQGLSSEQALGNLEAVEEMRESLMRNITETLALEVGLLKLEVACSGATVTSQTRTQS
jgi:DNA polymerase-3 subunit delta'